MCEIWTMGEMLVEMMRPRHDMRLDEPAEFVGPFPSGAPAIFIDTAARLGHTSGIIGGVGKDDFGKNILDRLRKDGVNIDYVYEDDSSATAVAFVTYFKDGSRKFIYHINHTPAVHPEIADPENIHAPEYFHIMGCSLMISDSFRDRIINTAHRFAHCGAKISFDPNIRPELLKGRAIENVLGDVLENCSVLMPGIDELKMITGMETVEDGIKKLFKNRKLEVVALKKGKKGSTIYNRNDQVDIMPFQITQIDPTGAGDCFDAAFLCGLLEGRSLLEAGKMAAAAGALNVMKRGPMEGDISRDKLEILMQEQRSLHDD